MTQYHLGSSPVLYAPGIIAWAVNYYAFEEDRPHLAMIMASTYLQVAPLALQALLIGAVPYTVEEDGVIFRFDGGDPPMAAASGCARDSDGEG